MLMDVPIPDISDDQVLVRMMVAGVGIHDRWAMPPDLHIPFPIGLEGAGIVEKVGSAVTGFEPGDRVMFSSIPQPTGGTWAEFTAVPAEVLMHIPDGLGFKEATALPMAGTTALEGIKLLGIGRGDRLFIAGASGAIGTLAIQLATMRGYRVAASASPKNHEYLRSLGAELAVDYRDPDWAQEVLQWAPGGVDAALAVQPGTGSSSLPAVRDGGKVVTISGDQVVPERNITVEQVSHHPETRNELVEFAKEVAAGHARVAIDEAYPFERGLDALEKSVTRHARGKIVIIVAEE
jgi:NADPH:quinone reductase-like Zn-dependent oxidoreductase